MTVPSFRRQRPPSLRGTAFSGVRREVFRGSARERGYDSDWDRTRNEYFRHHPHCEECKRRGYLVLAEVVDHMKPVEDAPSDRLNDANLDSLCHPCHNGWKRRIEAHARKLGLIDYLPVWIKHPENRPAGFRIAVTGPVDQDGAFATDRDG